MAVEQPWIFLLDKKESNKENHGKKKTTSANCPLRRSTRPGKLTVCNGKPPVLIGDTSSNGGFPIAMLVYRSVFPPGCFFETSKKLPGSHHESTFHRPVRFFKLQRRMRNIMKIWRVKGFPKQSLYQIIQIHRPVCFLNLGKEFHTENHLQHLSLLGDSISFLQCTLINLVRGMLIAPCIPSQLVNGRKQYRHEKPWVNHACRS